MLELYHYGPSLSSARVRLALCEKGVDWTSRHLDLLAGDQFAADYLAITPHAMVPAILHDGAAITESTVICEYIDQAFDGPALRPADALEQARMRMWTKLVDEEIHAAMQPITYAGWLGQELVARGSGAVEEQIAFDPRPSGRERRRRWISEGFHASDLPDALVVCARMIRNVDAALAVSGSEWLAGGSWSLADAALTPYAARLEAFGLAPMWAGQPDFARWLEAVKARPSFASTITDSITDDLRISMDAASERAGPEFCRILKRLGIT